MRQWIVWPIWFALAGFFVVFRPVYNGDMGIYSWRLRFASRCRPTAGAARRGQRADDWQTTPHDYPRFLGNGYWAEVKGVELETDWKAHPPQELWRREIGGGWSAFAIVGNYAVTQEQRGAHELVTCYRVDTGEPVWTHSDEARFDPADIAGSLGDIGPRATPTISRRSNLYARRHGHRQLPRRQHRRSDLVARHGQGIRRDRHAVGQERLAARRRRHGRDQRRRPDRRAAAAVGMSRQAYNSSLVAFDIDTGDVRWAAGQRQASYASPVLAELAGERQIIVVNESYVTAHRASDGKVLWEHPWARRERPERILLAAGAARRRPRVSFEGLRRRLVAADDSARCGRQTLGRAALESADQARDEDQVLQRRYARRLRLRPRRCAASCIELETGAVKWKKRRDPEFGHGQIMLIGDVILVLSETGELALVEASPERYHELASMQVLDDANVTWNNPAFAPPYLLVRNAREAACYRLPTK